jgi:hypothetical protein
VIDAESIHVKQQDHAGVVERAWAAVEKLTPLRQ